ncbi:MAG: TetR/AcrR family transcriptional regulator [Burkholderia sp.]|nr:TetR/AcrR family transcriptional regulator [Burkholderia sp.]
MRRSKADTAETRQHILNTASQAFRKHGIDSISLADIMAEAGLTHGGFYRHFGSKEQLVEEASSTSLLELIHLFRSVAAEKDAPRGLKAIASVYLSKDHRDNAAEGCPLAALAAEIGRSERGTRKAMTEGFRKLVDVVAEQLAPLPSETAKRRALAALSMMVGALTLSRMVSDPELSDAILVQAKKQLLETFQPG